MLRQRTVRRLVLEKRLRKARLGLDLRLRQRMVRRLVLEKRLRKARLGSDLGLQ